NFITTGVYFEPHEPPRKLADAESSFENCLFLGCSTGVSFTQFNDYDYTFDGCEFRQCGTGIRCMHGNFYARDCHFEESRTADVQAYVGEHGSTVRRCTSLNSNQFIENSNYVSTMVIEGCAVDNWKNPQGAIMLYG